jgi:hypothetical protein
MKQNQKQTRQSGHPAGLDDAKGLRMGRAILVAKVRLDEVTAEGVNEMR